MVSRVRSCLNYCLNQLKRFFPRARIYTYLIVHHSPSVSQRSTIRSFNPLIFEDETVTGELFSSDGPIELDRKLSISNNSKRYLFSRVTINDSCKRCLFSNYWILYSVYSRKLFSNKKYSFSRVSIQDFALEWIIAKDIYSRDSAGSKITLELD